MCSLPSIDWRCFFQIRFLIRRGASFKKRAGLKNSTTFWRQIVLRSHVNSARRSLLRKRRKQYSFLSNNTPFLKNKYSFQKEYSVSKKECSVFEKSRQIRFLIRRGASFKNKFPHSLVVSIKNKSIIIITIAFSSALRARAAAERAPLFALSARCALSLCNEAKFVVSEEAKCALFV